MTDQESVEARKAASTAGAADNSGLGVDGDDPSVADTQADHDESAPDDDTPASSS